MKKRLTPANLFIFLSIVGLVLTFGRLYMTHGDYWRQLFFYDKKDTGMDFFHSIEYTLGRMPYEKFHTLYPPLANLFYYILLRFIPQWETKKWADSYAQGIKYRATKHDLRVWQPTMMLFIIYCIVVAVLLIWIIANVIEMNNKSMAVGLFCLLSFGTLYAYERGNIIIVSAICIMFFLLYYDSKNRFLSELALFSLAIAAGLKLYPALFGIILLYDKKFFKAMRAVVYGIAGFILPFYVFKEKLSGFPIFLNSLLKHSANSSGEAGKLTYVGHSMDRLVNNAAYLFSKCFGFKIDVGFLNNNALIFNVAGTLAFLFLGFFLKKKWQKILSVSLALLLFQTQTFYLTLFMIVPLVFCIKEEEFLTFKNFIPVLAMSVMLILLPFTFKKKIVFSLQYIRIQICMVILMIYIIVLAIYRIFLFLNRKKNGKNVVKEEENSEKMDEAAVLEIAD